MKCKLLNDRISLLAICIVSCLIFFTLSNITYACQMSQECVEVLAQRESNGNYSATNTYDFLGRYQFGEAALIDAGFYEGDGYCTSCSKNCGGCSWNGGWTDLADSYGVTDRESFLNSPAAQDAALAAYQSKTWGYITNLGLDQYLGQTIGGIPITCDNLLTGYHLKGGGGLQTYLGSGGTSDPADAYGTKISEYLDLGADCQGMATGVMESANAFSSCSQEILSTGSQLGQMRMQVEKQQIDEAITKPTSVMELTCFDQFGEMFNNEIGAIFGNTQNDNDIVPGVGLERGDGKSFSDIFADAQGQIGSEILYAVSGGLVGTRGNTINSMISSQVQSAISNVLGGLGGGGGNVQFQCEAMNLLWELMQCEDIFDFKIPTLQDLIGDFNLRLMIQDMLPDSCTGQILGDYALDNVDNKVFSSSNESLPDALSPSNIERDLSTY